MSDYGPGGPATARNEILHTIDRLAGRIRDAEKCKAYAEAEVREAADNIAYLTALRDEYIEIHEAVTA